MSNIKSGFPKVVSTVPLPLIYVGFSVNPKRAVGIVMILQRKGERLGDSIFWAEGVTSYVKAQKSEVTTAFALYLRA